MGRTRTTRRTRNTSRTRTTRRTRTSQVSDIMFSESSMLPIPEFPSSVQDVKKLQKQLKERGFNPGKIDGKFGPATQAALLAFQESEELLPDSIVGPETAKALGLNKKNGIEIDPSSKSVISQIDSILVSKMFPFTQVDNIKTHLPSILKALKDVNLVSKEMVLMALATIRAETEGFVPISEGKSKYNTSPGGHPFDLYDNRKNLGNQGPPDGESFKGRGFVQLTGRDNYTRYGKKIGLGNKLVNDPDLANDTKIAADLLAHFIKNKERKIKEALLEDDLRTARKLVNGGSHGLDRFIDAYMIGEDLII